MEETIVVRMFGLLHSARSAAGLPSTVAVEISEIGRTARDIALELELELGLIEGVFVNRVVRDIDVVVMPGDRIAFVPYGTPGPHRYFLGLYKAGKEDQISADEG